MVRWRRLYPLAAVMLMVMASGCYLQDTIDAQNASGPVPWWCTSTEEIPVTSGPAVGSVDYYAGTHKAPLPWDQCKTVSAQFDIAKAYALQWPTAGDAVAAGWRMATPYVPGMGTHHVRGGITPQMLADPSFDRNNPILDAAGLDDVFDPAKPEVMQYDGNTSSAKLVGFDYYVRTSTGLPPAGFPGNNDWWHIHPKICFRLSDAVMVGFNTTDSNCTSQQGINVNMSNYYMLHVWVLDDMTFEPDVYAGMIPCIANGTAVHDPNDPCHTTRTMAGATAGDGSTHDMSTHDMSGMSDMSDMSMDGPTGL
ncbi:MAG: hypothetical protein ACXWCM_07270 [Acidimicrobiales bacterium]